LKKYYPDRRLWMIFGAMRDKAVDEMGAILFPLADELILTAADSPRSLPPEELVTLAGSGRTQSNIDAALQLLAREAAADDAIIISGSLFLVGEARAASYNKNSWPFSGAWS
jgi:dihydrofolate synthase/folylpolyglutamate synthase